MADGIRGKAPDTLPNDVQKGIVLHRLIDSYTDAHPIFRQSTKRLHPMYHHYAGVIVDIFYDHFLAKNWDKYHNTSLPDYTQQFYKLLEDNYTILTEKTQKLMPYMLKQDWLASYASTQGIAQILLQMDKRTKNKSGMTNSINELLEFYDDFEKEFTLFFEELRAFVNEKTLTL